MPWFDGPPLLEHLEIVVPIDTVDGDGPSPPAGPVGHPGPAPTIRTTARYAGRIEGGRLRPGDAVVALPSGITTRVASIDTFDGPLDEAFAPLSVAVRLTDDVDLGRGGLLAGADDAPPATASSTRSSAGSAIRRSRPAGGTGSPTRAGPFGPSRPRSSRASTSTRSSATRDGDRARGQRRRAASA